jgi:hypothetical protein
MSVLERPHYVIKPAELAKWLDREPDTWWLVDGDPLLTGVVDFPCPSGELTEVLRRSKRELFLYPADPTSPGPQPTGQPVKWQHLDDLVDRENPEKARTFWLSWSDQSDEKDEWVLTEYPSWKLEDDER